MKRRAMRRKAMKAAAEGAASAVSPRRTVRFVTTRSLGMPWGRGRHGRAPGPMCFARRLRQWCTYGAVVSLVGLSSSARELGGALRAKQASVNTSFEDALKRVFVFVPHGNGGAGALAHASLLVDQRDPGGAVMVALAMASVSPARPRGVSRKKK